MNACARALYYGLVMYAQRRMNALLSVRFEDRKQTMITVLLACNYQSSFAKGMQ